MLSHERHSFEYLSSKKPDLQTQLLSDKVLVEEQDVQVELPAVVH